MDDRVTFRVGQLAKALARRAKREKKPVGKIIKEALAAWLNEPEPVDRRRKKTSG